MARLLALALIGLGLLASCSKEEPGAHFGPGPGGEEMEDTRCK